MDQKDHNVSQYMAMFCIIFGALVAIIGAKFHWPEITTMGAGTGGAGLQAFQSQIRSVFNSKNTDVTVGDIKT